MTTDQLSRVGAWRHVAEHGDYPPAARDRTALLAQLAAHAGQRLIVALDAPLEHEPPGSGRLRQVLTAWLDLARTAPRVHELLERDATGPARALLDQQRRLVLDLLAEDLGAAGAPDPWRAAAVLLDRTAAVAGREQAAGRPLRRERAALLWGPAGVPAPRSPQPSLLRRLHLLPA